MSTSTNTATDTATNGSATVQQPRIDALLDRCRREIEAGLLPSCQVAVGFEGEIVAQATFGDATDDTRYCIFSATKPFVASTVWQLISEGLVDLDATAASYVPAFGENGKDEITVEQVMLHTSGFPHAPLGPPRWDTSASRLEAMAEWRLNWEPGTRYEYHPTSAHWVLGEIINAVTGSDYRDEVHRRVTEPLGLGRLLGLAPDEQDGIAELMLVGERATPDELEATFGVRELPMTEVTNEVILRFNEPSVREVGVPGGGAFGTAVDIALFYQGLLHNPGDLWEPEMLATGTGEVRNTLPDPMGMPANRSIGLFLAGDDGLSNMRGLGRTVSPMAFGHNGAGGQLAWADPATGLSFGYTTNGYDEHEVRQPRRDTAISSLAALCTTPA